MSIVAHTHPFIIGVDTHARSHALTVLAAPQGEQLDSAQFPNTPRGVARAIDWTVAQVGERVGQRLRSGRRLLSG